MTLTQGEYIRRTNLVLDYISQHLHEELDLDTLADVAMFSKFHFHRIFKAMVGETVQEYIRRIRLEKAANLLCIRQDIPIMEVAMTCGYSSQSNFAKAFKKCFHISPSDMRGFYYDRNPGISESNRGEVSAGNSTHIYSVESTGRKNVSPEMDWSIMEVEIKTLPKREVAYVRSIGEYSANTIGPAYDRLCQWAGPRGLLNDNPLFLGISWDNPDITPPSKCRYDASVVVPPGTDVTGDIGRMVLDSSDYAVYHCVIRNYEFAEAWNRFCTEWLPASGYQPDDRPVLEQYYFNDSKREEGTFIVDLCLPVKPL